VDQFHIAGDGVYAWGNNTEGECGLNKRTPKVFAPRKIPFFKDIDIQAIASGSTHCLALAKNGFVYAYVLSLFKIFLFILHLFSHFSLPSHFQMGLE
jgi:hypothetical protein